MGLDHGQVQRGGHAVVQERCVAQLAVVVVEVLFVQRHADALGGTALHLALDVGGVNGRTHVLNGRVAQNLDLAGVGIDLDIDDVRREGRAGR